MPPSCCHVNDDVKRLYLLGDCLPLEQTKTETVLDRAVRLLELVPEAHRWFASQAGLASDAGDGALTVVWASDVHKQLLLVRGKLASPEHSLAIGSPEVVSLLLTHLASLPNELLRAAECGKLADVQVYLNKGVNVNCTNDYGQTPLHHAATYGCVDVARLLLEKGANVEASNANGSTPLYMAAQANKPEMVQLLLEKGAEIDAKNNGGETPLEVAEARGSNDPVATLLRDYPRMQGEKLCDALREKRIDDVMRILENNFLHVNLRDSM
ncbi:hypothetical protein SPRG_21688 [Saprolegnia parasitica CBS 223.65]|uniref:Uncharacterized protein n=1 Tax=Saprolegnia parasitica (strain CBS 223.65) TaxID=695850 RepID=A0A067BJC8_SAPPC|nr:hypothetical protein SPRG_21688 [Saprolegnia parasitica CBS 223.65]KDO18258.1 hypothetical protein SPRG_21688 [Saprolegnia parasitica CBS 223.65]|eukprot:XP_012211034.1 hypothetical protein SPRG_21688 [Saprolegnia parasitica CBS 223.65]